MKDFGGKVGQRMIDKFFRRVDNVVWDLMTGKIGFLTKEGIATLEGEGDEAEVQINLFDNFGMRLPAFAQNTPVNAIQKGDLIYNGPRNVGWVVKLPEEGKKQFTLLRPDGARGTWQPTKVTSIGMDLSGAMVLRSLVNTVGESGLGNMQNMLLPLLMMSDTDDGSDINLDKMMPLLLMNQLGTAGDGSNNMVSMMLMMQMMKGSNNPFAMAGDDGENPSWFGR